MTMPNQVQLVRQTVASLMVCGLIASLLSGFAAALYAQTVDPESVLGDTTIPSMSFVGLDVRAPQTVNMSAPLRTNRSTYEDWPSR